ncbi:YceI family protein [Phenylobacterium sp.]|uniref:YceI family protein n=1 Tax=Phenylobacterium sp. TaxID=1871053 RepID=UPI0025CC97FA|nr:YceI family protein [Phenylobacterium sp.]
MTARTERYATVAIVLHWTIAALIVLQIVIAGRMEGRTPEAFAVLQLHKSLGITVLLLSLLRLAWRFANPPPPEPATLARWERTLSLAVHWGFYVVMILMPVTGWIIVSTSRTAIPTLLYGVVPWPHIPGLPELAPAARHTWHEAGETAHGLIIKGAYVLIALHVAGALKHQLFRRDEPVLSRMAPGATGGRWLEPRLFAIAAGAAAVVAFGYLYRPPLPHTAPAAPPVAAEADVAPSTGTPAPATAATSAPTGAVKWIVQPGSSLRFGTEWSGTAIGGRFDRWTADIVFAPDDLANSNVRVAIDMASVDTGDAQRDQSLPAADWFDTATHPKATFTATRFTAAGEGRYVAHGTLTLRGVSKPLTLPFRLTIDGDRATVSGVTSLDRTAFGVGQGEWQKTDQIPAKVSVRIDLKARRASP